jgi:hypothetical protein
MHPHPSFGNGRHEVFASKKIWGGRAPEGANPGPHQADAARAERSALAFRRSTAALAPTMCRSSIQAALHAMQRAGVTRALASRLSEAPRAPVIMPAGSMPGPPGSGSDEPPPAGTAPAPSVGVTGRRPLTVDGMERLLADGRDESSSNEIAPRLSRKRLKTGSFLDASH